MNYGILVVLPYVVIYENVLDILVKGVHPQRLPPTDREGITDPPGWETQRTTMRKGRMKGQRPENTH